MTLLAYLASAGKGDLEGALEPYRGDFLEGFSIAGISLELEEWLEAERDGLRGLAADAAATLAERTPRSGELGAAVQWARKGLSLSPGDGSMLRRLVTLLHLHGDRASALRTAEHLVRRIHDELGVGPSPETQQLITELRAHDEAASSVDRGTDGVADPVVAHSAVPSDREDQAPSDASHPASISSAEPLTPVTPSAPADSLGDTAPGAGNGQRTGGRTCRRVAIAAAASVILAAVVAIGAVRLHAERSAPPVIAVGWISVGERVDDGGAARLLYALLETGLSSVPGQRTISDARLHYLLRQMGDREESRGAVARAARLAGATELLEGAVSHSSGGGLRLDLRRVDIDDGVVVRSYRPSSSGGVH